MTQPYRAAFTIRSADSIEMQLHIKLGDGPGGELGPEDSLRLGFG